MVCVEEIVGNNLIVVVRSMSKGAAAIAVTQGPDAGHAGLQLIVNNDVAAIVRSQRRPGQARGRVCSECGPPLAEHACPKPPADLLCIPCRRRYGFRASPV